MYREYEHGRFNVALVCATYCVAYTDYDCVKLTEWYSPKHKEAVVEFADAYDLPIIWGDKDEEAK